MEYAGFVPVEGIDISGLTQKVSDKIFDIGEVRKKKKQDLEDLTQKMMDESAIEMTDNNVINDKIAKFTEQYQNAIHENHKKLTSGQMSPSEYQRYMETAKRNIDAYAKSANSLDETIAKQAERIRKGEAGALQAEQIANLERIVSLENNQRVDENGRLVIDMPDGRVVAVDALTKPGMFISRRIDLQGDLDESMKKWDANGMWNKFGIGGIEKWESLRDNDAYDLAKKKLALSMVSGDGMQSVLLDHGGIEGPVYVYSKADAEKAIQEEIDRLSKLKEGKEITEEELEEIRNKVVLMDSKGRPVFTEEQEKKALDLVQNAIDMRAAEKANLTVTKPFDPRSGTTSTTQQRYQDKQEQELESARLGYESIVRAINVDTADPQDLRALEAKAKSPVKFTKRKEADGSYRIYAQPTRTIYEAPSPAFYYDNILSESLKNELSEKGWLARYETWAAQDRNKTIDKQVPSGPEVPINEGIELAQYVFGGDLNDAQRLYELGKGQSPSYDQQVKDYYAKEYWAKKKAGQKPMTLGEWLKTQSGTTNTTVAEDNNDPLKLGL